MNQLVSKCSDPAIFLPMYEYVPSVVTKLFSVRAGNWTKDELMVILRMMSL